MEAWIDLFLAKQVDVFILELEEGTYFISLNKEAKSSEDVDREVDLR